MGRGGLRGDGGGCVEEGIDEKRELASGGGAGGEGESGGGEGGGGRAGGVERGEALLREEIRGDGVFGRGDELSDKAVAAAVDDLGGDVAEECRFDAATQDAAA